jgi:hypothetical protein
MPGYKTQLSSRNRFGSNESALVRMLARALKRSRLALPVHIAALERLDNPGPFCGSRSIQPAVSQPRTNRERRSRCSVGRTFCLYANR